MKAMLIGLLLLSGAVAQAECTQLEAQVIARVQNVIAEDTATCTVSLDYSSRFMLNPSYVCPLDVDDVSIGVTLPKIDGACSVRSGDMISGVLYKALNGTDGRVYLE